MTDPAEIDLKHLKAKLAIRVRLGKTDSESLIAAVEALRERVAEQAGALDQLIEEKADYMRLNNLGNPETQHTIKVGRAALAAMPTKESTP